MHIICIHIYILYILYIGRARVQGWASSLDYRQKYEAVFRRNGTQSLFGAYRIYVAVDTSCLQHICLNYLCISIAPCIVTMINIQAHPIGRI